MKQVLILFAIISLCATCIAPKSAFETAHNKKFIGNIDSVVVIKRQRPMGKFSIVYTDLPESFMIDSKVNVERGTPCYVYSNPMGTEVYVVWEDAKESYLIK